MQVSVSRVLRRIHALLSSPHPSLTTQERNRTIRARHAAGESQAQLARDFGISYQRVYQIIHGKRK